jgi:arginyl-tRNA synthetase
VILSLQHDIHRAVAAVLRDRLGLTDVPAFTVDVPPSRTMGDLGVSVAFQLARSLKKPPRAIADAIAAGLPPLPGIARVAPAPNGYLNFHLDRPAFLLARAGQGATPAPLRTGKTIVEHTAINPNKAAHVGHLRNAALGDTLVRVLRFGGVPVEVQNYIDDTGVQVADVIVGFRHLESRSIEEVRHIADTTRFDYYCWDLYSRVTAWYDEDKARLEVRAQTLHDLEQGEHDTAAFGAFIVDRIVGAHLRTMARLNISYDLLTYEGDILRLRFWAQAFEILKARGALYLQTEGRHAGCWVMRIEEGEGAAGDAAEQDAAGEERDEAREKVIVRSNGVVTYVGKDIANQFWKFGLLGRDFHYRRFADQADGRPLWATTSGDGLPGAPPFGRADRIYNVIDSRQMYLQALLVQALRALGHAREADHSIHFSYEMVGLSHATARALGYPEPAPGEPRKPFVEVSGRKGLGVKIDDLLDLLAGKASAEVLARNPEMSPADCARTGTQIAVAAIRYFMLKYSRGKLIVFDMEEALSFEGETGPYLQYAVVRAGNILQKLKEREGLSEGDVLALLPSQPPDELTDGGGETGDDSLWAVVFEASRLDEIVEQVIRSLEFSGLAKYTFGLAQVFNAFYHRYPILAEERTDRKYWRAAGVAYVRDQLTRALALMGIEVPARM